MAKTAIFPRPTAHAFGRASVCTALAFLMGVAAPAAARRTTVGVHGGWAVFRDDAPTRCFAVSAPDVPARGAFAAVLYWPDRRVRGQVHVRLHRPARPGSAVVLTIDGALFQLTARGVDAWASAPAADRAIVAAMRTGVIMTVTARDENGGAMRFGFALGGAATAIDAAALACRPQG